MSDDIDSIRRAGIGNEGDSLGDALFDAIVAAPHGLTFTLDDYDETMRRIETPDGKVSLVIPDLLADFAPLADAPPASSTDEYPRVLSAGERRSSTANTIQRDPSWRKKVPQGALRVSIDDAERYGLVDGDRARVTTKRGSAIATVEVTDTLLPGHISLPNGFGLGGSSDAVGVAPNELTASGDRVWIAGTPHHKHGRARMEKVAV